MSDVKENPNDPIIRNALTTEKNNDNPKPSKELEDPSKEKVRAGNGKQPDTAAEDESDFDAKSNNIHKKR